jgi:hypothetical protein
MQAVEQEMGIELVAQRLQFGFARQGARLGGLPFRFLRSLHCQGGIMQPPGEQVEQHPHAEQQRQMTVKPLFQAGHFPRLRDRRRREPRPAYQNQAARRRRHAEGDRQALPAVRAERQGAADVPGRQAGESVHQARRRQHYGGVHPSDAPGGPHDVNQQGQQRDPGQQVQPPGGATIPEAGAWRLSS